MEKRDNVRRMYELLENFLDDSLSAEEQNELADILEHSEKARTSAAQFLRLEGGLVNLGRLGQITAEELREKERVPSRRAAHVPASSRRMRVKQQRKRIWSIWIAVAACLVIAGGVYLYNIYQVSQIPGLIKAKLIEAKGGVIVERNGKRIRAQEGMEIISGDSIKTEAEGQAILKYDIAV